MRSGFGVFNCTGQEPDRAGRHFEDYVAGERHFPGMTEQAEIQLRPCSREHLVPAWLRRCPGSA